ncbi:AF4/FMR2 family member 4, partial [Cyclospora cayetanensis]|uniref:AF4/FMR2 family member 4 n=1 Tax=Cyclospora cayetanensis TaxID=88456 RepID=A0A6P6RUU7_9EIME
EAEDPLLLLSLPPPSSLCRFLALPQQGAVGRASKQRTTAAKDATSRGTSHKPQPHAVGLGHAAAASVPLSRVLPSFLPDFLRRHFQLEVCLSREKQDVSGVVVPQNCIQHPTYSARVSKLSPLSVVLLISLLARLRQRQQQKQHQQVTGSCLLYAQRLSASPPPSLLQQMHTGKPFVCFCCSRRFSSSASKLLHLERHMRRRRQKQQQQQQHQMGSGGGVRHTTAASRIRSIATATAARQPWPAVASWIRAASCSSPESDSPATTAALAAADAEGGGFSAAGMEYGLQQQMAATAHALNTLARAELRQHEEVQEDQEIVPQEDLPEGRFQALKRHDRFPSWLPPSLGLHIEAAAGIVEAAQRASASGGLSGGEAECSKAGASALEHSASAATAREGRPTEQQQQQQATDLARVTAEAARQLQQHETKLWQWCLAAADFGDCSREPPLPVGNSWGEENSSEGSDCAHHRSVPLEAPGGALKSFSASPRQWAAALSQLAAALPCETTAALAKAAHAIATGESAAAAAAAADSESLLNALRQCAVGGAAANAASVCPARVLVQEAERMKRCYLCGCGFQLQLDEQQQQYYLPDTIGVVLQQQPEQQQLAAAIVAAVAPAVRSAVQHTSDSENMCVEGSIEGNNASIRLMEVTAAAAAISSAPQLRLAAVHPVGAFASSRSTQHQQGPQLDYYTKQQQQQQQPKYMELSSCIGAQPAALSVALDLEGALLLSQSTVAEGSAASAVASAGGRAACAADAAAAAAYRSLVSMDLTEGDLDPHQQEMVSLLRQQLPESMQIQKRAAAPVKHASACTDASATGAQSELTLQRVLPTDLVYVHRDCYLQHLQQHSSFFRLLILLLLLRWSNAPENKHALLLVGQVLLQLVQEQCFSNASRKRQQILTWPEHMGSLETPSSTAAWRPPAIKVRKRF